ncbi:NUDIX domain-containing protein [Paenibacillus sp.]|uniref:NUDIX domain-containing protein n=1 Tax=Paenibacillus sp. TaxID=58172 RepID=UPI002D362BF3|nr:NUDIX domain-containing protein [Paenibacillus sp.]HZG86685.1 NUDIX domain-containing protein [Paenibacillus sp.]
MRGTLCENLGKQIMWVITKMNRERACSAILFNGKIIMVKVVEKDHSFWTLPGGGVEAGESREQAAIREVMEEVNLEINIVRYLFERKYAAGIEYCYLAEPKDIKKLNIELGYDPELEDYEQVLKQVEWFEIDKVREDLHVSRVIESLSQEEINKYNVNVVR